LFQLALPGLGYALLNSFGHIIFCQEYDLFLQYDFRHTTFNGGEKSEFVNFQKRIAVVRTIGYNNSGGVYNEQKYKPICQDRAGRKRKRGNDFDAAWNPDVKRSWYVFETGCVAPRTSV
jgi:hypothetical protein